MVEGLFEMETSEDLLAILEKSCIGCRRAGFVRRSAGTYLALSKETLVFSRLGPGSCRQKEIDLFNK